MMILLLSKLVKNAWLGAECGTEIRDGVIVDLTVIILKNDEKHVLVGLQAIDQLITEMTCPSKGGLLQDRQISVNFKNNCLETIFRHNMELLEF